MQPVDVLNLARLDHARHDTAVADHVHLERFAQRQAGHHRDHNRRQNGGVDQNAWPQHVTQGLRLGPMLLHGVFGGVLDQAACVAHFVHHFVADIGAGTTADALVLQAFADINAGRTDLDTQAAIDAGTQVQLGGIGLA